MKMAKTKRIAAACLLVLLCLSSCTQEGDVSPSAKGGMDLSEFDTVLALRGNTVYGYRFLEDGGCEFLSWDAGASKGLTHGSAQSFSISTDSVAFIGDTLYVPIAAAGGNGADEFQIALYSFNAQSSCDSKLLYTGKSPLVYSKAAGKLLLLLHTTIDHGQLITSIDRFDPGANKLEPFLSKSCDAESRSGSQILAFDYDADHARVFVLLQEHAASPKVLVNSYSLQNKEQLSSTDITNLAPAVTSQAILDFRALGDYLYIRNFSDSACFCKLEKDGCAPLVYGDYEHPFVLANQSDWNPNDGFLFFLRGSGFVYSYTAAEGAMEKIDASKYGEIANIYRDGGNLLLVLREDAHKIYYQLVSMNTLLEGAEASFPISADHPVNAKDLY